MGNKLGVSEISFSKLKRKEKTMLIKARNFADKQALKYYGCQFSDSNEKNMELLGLFYSKPIHDIKLSKILKLGLQYYSGLLLAHNLPSKCAWSYRYFHNIILLGVEDDIGRTTHVQSVKKHIEQADNFESFLKWNKKNYLKLANHKHAIERYRALNDGENPIWERRKLFSGIRIKNIPSEKWLEFIIDKYPQMRLFHFIKHTKMLRSRLSDVYIDHVALYLNCKRTEPIGNLEADQLFQALWQCP